MITFALLSHDYINMKRTQIDDILSMSYQVLTINKGYAIVVISGLAPFRVRYMP